MLDPEIKEIQITRYQKCIFGTLALDIFLNNSLNLKKNLVLGSKIKITIRGTMERSETQSQKNLVSGAALLSGKFLQISGKFLQ